MHDPITIPACFSAAGGSLGVAGDDPSAAAVTRSGQSAFISLYRTKIADKCRLMTVTWYRNLLLHGLSVAIDSAGAGAGDSSHQSNSYACKVELKPWYFWRKTGSKRFALEGGQNVNVFWDLRSARFSDGDTAEPTSGYYVAVVCHQEVVLLLGDLKNDAYRKSWCRPALIDPILVSRKEYVFGKNRFATQARFHENGRVHKISIECQNGSGSGSGTGWGSRDMEMEIRADGQVLLQVKHLQWKFRGNETIKVGRLRVEVYWDVHDWLFRSGLRHALFVFKPMLRGTSTTTTALPSPAPATRSPNSGQVVGISGFGSGLGPDEGFGEIGSSEFCLFLYAWRAE